MAVHPGESLRNVVFEQQGIEAVSVGTLCSHTRRVPQEAGVCGVGSLWSSSACLPLTPVSPYSCSK